MWERSGLAHGPGETDVNWEKAQPIGVGVWWERALSRGNRMDKASETRKFGESPKQAETGDWSPGSKGAGHETRLGHITLDLWAQFGF